MLASIAGRVDPLSTQQVVANRAQTDADAASALILLMGAPANLARGPVAAYTPHDVNLRLATYLALQLARSRKFSTLSLVSMISVVGIAVGVWALIIVMGVTNGFQQSFQERILGLYPHLVIHKRGTEFREYPDIIASLRDTTGVLGASPVTYDDMMIAAGVQRTGAIIKGIDIETVGDVVNIDSLLKDGATLKALGESPKTFAVDNGGLVVEGLIAGTWNTAVVAGGQVTHFLDDTTPPDPGHGRVRVLDLREPSKREPVTLSRVNSDDLEAPNDGAKAGLPGASLGLIPLGKVLKEAPLSRDLVLGAATASSPKTPATEVPAGSYDLRGLNERFAVDAGTIVTLVLLAKEKPRWWVQPREIPLREGTALLRTLIADGGKSLTAVSVEGLPIPAAELAVDYRPVQAVLPGVFLGVSLAERLGVKLGDEVSLVTPLRGVDSKMLGPFGATPSSTRHRLAGVFESGFYEYDIRLALVNIDAAQRFLNRGRTIRWIEVKTDNLLEIEGAKRRVAAVLDPYDMDTITDNGLAMEGHLERLVQGDVGGVSLKPATSFLGGVRNASRVLGVLKSQEYDLGYTPRYRLIDWKEMNSNLFGALKLQKVVLALFFSIIIIVGAFVVVGSQMMIIHDKAADIAILKAMGARRSLIRLTFTIQGLIVASIGCTAGVVFGVATCLLISAVDYDLEASIYLIDRLPATVEWGVIAMVTVGALVTTMLATQYSAGRAASKTPVEGLRAVE